MSYLNIDNNFNLDYEIQCQQYIEIICVYHRKLHFLYNLIHIDQ